MFEFFKIDTFHLNNNMLRGVGWTFAYVYLAHIPRYTMCSEVVKIKKYINCMKRPPFPCGNLLVVPSVVAG